MIEPCVFVAWPGPAARTLLSLLQCRVPGPTQDLLIQNWHLIMPAPDHSTQQEMRNVGLEAF